MCTWQPAGQESCCKEWEQLKIAENKKRTEKVSYIMWNHIWRDRHCSTVLENELQAFHFLCYPTMRHGDVMQESFWQGLLCATEPYYEGSSNSAICNTWLQGL